MAGGRLPWGVRFHANPEGRCDKGERRTSPSRSGRSGGLRSLWISGGGRLSQAGGADVGEGGICWATERRHGSGQGFAVCTVGAIGYVIWAAEVDRAVGWMLQER